MNFKPQQNVNLAELTTFKVGGKAKYFTQVTSTDQLPEIFAWLKEHKLPHFILSGGSNTIFGDNEFPGLVLRIDIKGFEIIKEDDDAATIKVAAGEDWDEVVGKVTSMGLSGIEALSAIPGLTGTAPVQNIGAYGQEIKDTIESVEVFDTKAYQITTLSNSDCKFDYRDSIFKSSQKNRYIITSITLVLSKQPPTIPNYPDVIDYFESLNLAQPSLQQIREAIISIRAKKLPDPNKIPNAGSFFKNPIVEKGVLDNLQAKFPDIKSFPFGNKFKLSAAWLIEQSGLKGKKLGHVQIDPNHALVLENTGGASQKDLLKLIENIQLAVKTKFGIQLDPEPEIVKY